MAYKRRRNVLYVLKCQSYYKIGTAVDFKARFSALNNNPFDVDFVMCCLCKKASVPERYLHWVFRDKNKKREWFALDSNDLGMIRKLMECITFGEFDDSNIFEVERTGNAIGFDPCW